MQASHDSVQQVLFYTHTDCSAMGYFHCVIFIMHLLKENLYKPCLGQWMIIIRIFPGFDSWGKYADFVRDTLKIKDDPLT